MPLPDVERWHVAAASVLLVTAQVAEDALCEELVAAPSPGIRRVVRITTIAWRPERSRRRSMAATGSRAGWTWRMEDIADFRRENVVLAEMLRNRLFRGFTVTVCRELGIQLPIKAFTTRATAESWLLAHQSALGARLSRCPLDGSASIFGAAAR